MVVLTALDSEYVAVRRRLSELRVHRHERGTRFEIGTLAEISGRIVLAQVGKGNQATAVLTERAIQRFDPAAVLFVGVAGALWDSTQLGDIVVATHVYAYHGGTSEDDGLKARPRAWEAPHGLSQLATHLSRTGCWAKNLPTDRPAPRVHFGPIAAGEVVQNSRLSAEAAWIRQHYNDAIAIEMEAAGLAQAGHLNNAPVAVVRGISDFADGGKTSEADARWQPHAVDNAAAFALHLAQELITEREQPTMNDPEPSLPRGSTHNTGTGQVGIQANQVFGSTVYFGGGPPSITPADLSSELRELRSSVDRSHANGTLDDPTYKDARTQLDTATSALESTSTPEGASTFVLALKRLRGLTSDIGEIVTKIAAIIAAVNGLS
ncbi:5'-methylthioadenosine/S-adenosylhomocysteine nucleosidase [Prauserella marina]|uniref:5'-methylthioadenosine/S-adenosylhomocysteine nucleosidase family protein n=1 Tax=Prauserella marina TaxID=530584 RepID=UPI001FE4E8EA|nr:5'-methylthioadenosine/S-adenosylhomocysteine nucleosidase [Prauserella marina]